MGVNAQTAVPAFTAGQVLTAAQMTEVNTGIPVFATTVTRDAAFGGSGEKVLAQGQYAFIEATNTTQFYDGAAWNTLGGGLTLVKSQVVGSAVASVQVTSAFSATYDNYIITYNNGSSSATDQMNMIVGATTSGYYYNITGTTWNATFSGNGSTTSVHWPYVGETNSVNGVTVYAQISSPFLAKRTEITSRYMTTVGGYTMQGMLDNTTSYTSFTFSPNAGTITGGTIRVYGFNI
jgi:hypothetical protein